MRWNYGTTFWVINPCELAPGHIIQISVSGLAIKKKKLAEFPDWFLGRSHRLLALTVRLTDFVENHQQIAM